MKFAKQFEKSLIEDDIPEEWIEAAIQYKALKKCIGKVVKELSVVGLEQNTLKLLLNNVEVNEEDTSASNPIVAHYMLKKTKRHYEIVPSLKIIVDYSRELSEDDINISLRSLRRKFEVIVNGTTSESEILSTDDGDIVSDGPSERSGDIETLKEFDDQASVATNNSSETNKSLQTRKSIDSDKLYSSNQDTGPKTVIEKVPGFNKKYEISIRLNSDAKFFHMLKQELDNLDKLRVSEEEKLISDIQRVGEALNNISHVELVKKSDIYKWRQVFKMFIDNEVYFKTNNSQVNSFQNSTDKVEERLNKFKQNLDDTKILTSFKNRNSLKTFNQFLIINETLLKILKFQTINSQALTKILKKFDKRTSLNVKSKIPNMITPDHIFMSGTSIARNICSIIQKNVLTIVPQLDDFLCPICADIAYKPIRLSCGHVFCVRCLVKHMQLGHDECPFCKTPKAVELADLSNIDQELALKMIKFFPSEVKAKLKDRQKERYQEITGDSKCVII